MCGLYDWNEIKIIMIGNIFMCGLYDWNKIKLLSLVFGFL